MSKIDKLNITGIRSFNAQRGETIQFYTPLTLIVGINGSGKTTIVECLKYVTTGILPPGAKVGGAFIHDPKLLGEKEVMAQVKLQFKDNAGARLVITRSLQLTVKKTTRTQKSLEGSLLTENNGEKTTASSRVADLDLAVPSHLGVSPAVLDNVIFCHQEESLWPLSEPSNLKKKFDEIFEAQKYIKAIDNIKQIRKKHNEELGKYKIMAQHAKEDRDRSLKARRKLGDLEGEIIDLQAQSKEVEEKMEQTREAADKAWKQSESYARILGALEGKEIEANTYERSIKKIKDHLKEMTEPDDWLEQTLERFNTTMQQYQDERDSKREQWLEWKDQIKELQDNMALRLSEKGKHEQETEEHERQLERRKEMIKTAATKHHLRGFDDLTDASLVEEFLYKIKKITKDQHVALDRARDSADKERQEISSTIGGLVKRKEALQTNKTSARSAMDDNNKQAGELQRMVNQIKVDEGSRAALETRVENVNVALQGAREAAQRSDWDTRLREEHQRLQNQEAEKSRLSSELIQGTKKAGEVARLAHLKQELKEKQRSLQTLLSAHSDRIKTLIGTAWNASDVDTTHRAALDESSREVTIAERERDAVAREIDQVQTRQKSVKDEINAKTQQVKANAASVESTIERDISEYDDALKEAQNHVDFARDEAKGIEGLADYFNKLLATANEKNTCRVCERPFKSAEDPGLKKMKRKLEGLIKKAAVDSEHADLASAEEMHKRVLDAGISVAIWKKLSTEELPVLETELNKLGQSRDALLKKIDKHDRVVEQKQFKFKDLEAVSQTVSSISRCETDIQTLSGQIEELSTKQSQQGITKTLEDIEEEIRVVTENVRSTQKAISQLTAERDTTKNQIHELEIESLDLKNEMDKTTSQLEKKASLVARVENFKSLNRRQRQGIDDAEKEIEKIEPQIAAAEAKQEDSVRRWKSQLSELAREATELSETANGLNLLNEQIKSFMDRGVSQQLSSVERNIAQLTKEMQDADTAQVQLTREISKIDEQLRDSESTKRQYADNLEYRRELRSLEELRDEIAELSSRNAKVDRDRFQEEHKRYTNQYHKFSATRQGHLAVMKTKDQQLAELQKEFDTDLKDAPKRYKDAHIKVETTKAAVEDLARYGGALDKAIMKFHTIKMAQINEIIEELWQKTYQGTDVDSIMIRSDAENTDANGNVKASASVTSTRRNYNYRVVMSKHGVEMDMRGRCSAGQKVLACIIIRLALAEVFSANCGLIALDEPTTNLDRDNIQALASSLHDIITTRQRQSNFQLIVITHDEEFLSHMQCGDFTDYYYRVSRDGVGDSIIERQDIVEVDR